MIPVRYAELWPALKNRLNSLKMQSILGGPHRVYIEGENYAAPEGPEGGQWGRLVIVPTSTAWPIIPVPGQFLKLGILIRVEMNNFQNVNYNPQIALEGAQVEANVQLAGWAMPGLNNLRLVFPWYLAVPWQPLPLWDDPRGVYFISSQYRTEVTAVSP